MSGSLGFLISPDACCTSLILFGSVFGAFDKDAVERMSTCVTDLILDTHFLLTWHSKRGVERANRIGVLNVAATKWSVCFELTSRAYKHGDLKSSQRREVLRDLLYTPDFGTRTGDTLKSKSRPWPEARHAEPSNICEQGGDSAGKVTLHSLDPTGPRPPNAVVLFVTRAAFVCIYQTTSCIGTSIPKLHVLFIRMRLTRNACPITARHDFNFRPNSVASNTSCEMVAMASMSNAFVQTLSVRHMMKALV